MKILLFFVLSLALFLSASGQATLPLRADTVVIEKIGGNSTLKIKNSTSVSQKGGILYNIANGVTAFKKTQKYNDTCIIIGGDTICGVGAKEECLWPAERPVGVMYSKNSWVNASDFKAYGAATLTSNGNYLDLSGGTGYGNDYVTVLTPTALSKYKMTLGVKLTGALTASSGLAFGLVKLNSVVPYDLSANFSFSNAGTTPIYIATTNGGGTVLQTSAGSISFSQNDSLKLEFDFNVNSLTVTAANLTTGAPATTTTYSWANPPDAAGKIPASCRFAIYSIGGTQQINGLEISSNETRYASVAFIGNSKEQLGFAGTWNGRFGPSLNSTYGTTITRAGEGDGVASTLAGIEEIRMLAPRIAILSIGSNSYRQGYATAQIIATYDSLTAAIEAIGTKVYHMVLPEDTVDNTINAVGMTYLKNYIESRYSENYIGGVFDTLATSNRLKSGFDYGDGIHLNQAAIDAAVIKIIASGKINVCASRVKDDAFIAAQIANPGGVGLKGSGTDNMVAKFKNNDLQNSSIYDNGTSLGIGTITPSYRVDIAANIDAGQLVNIKNSNPGSSSGAGFQALNDVDNAAQFGVLSNSYSSSFYQPNDVFLQANTASGATFHIIRNSAGRIRFSQFLAPSLVEVAAFSLTGRLSLQYMDSSAGPANIVWRDPASKELRLSSLAAASLNLSNSTLTANADYTHNWNNKNFFIDSTKNGRLFSYGLNLGTGRNTTTRIQWGATNSSFPIYLSGDIQSVGGSDSASARMTLRAGGNEIYSHIIATNSVNSTELVTKYKQIDMYGRGSSSANDYSRIGLDSSKVFINPQDSIMISGVVRNSTAFNRDSMVTLVAIRHDNLANNPSTYKVAYAPAPSTHLVKDSASSVSSVNIDLSSFANYDRIVIYIDKVDVSNNGVELRARFSNNGGSSFASGASDYEWIVNWRISPNGAGVNGDDADDHITLVQDISNVSGHSASGEIELMHPNDVNYQPLYKGEFISNFTTTGVIIRGTVGGRQASNTLVNAVSFFPSAGTFDKFKYRVIGYKN